MNKVYLINWGYYSCNESGESLAAIYTTREKALEHIKETELRHSLKQQVSKQDNRLLDCWSDGDYWVCITEAHLDSPSLFMSKYEWEAM